MPSEDILRTSTFGSAVNTGDITFNDAEIIGAGTIELVPDAELYEENQYLVIDPTNPRHIHIRAGGEPDLSEAILFLGGENAHVRVSNNDLDLGDSRDYTVSIRTHNYEDEIVYDWIFNNDGSLNLPSAGKIVNNSNEWTFGLDGQTVLPENTLKGYIFTATNTVINYIPQSAAFLYADNDIVRLVQAGWYIKGTGLIGWKQITAVLDNGPTLIMRIGDGGGPLEDGSAFPSGGGHVYTISQYLDFDLQVADKTWQFGEDGKLNFPGWLNSQSFNKTNGSLEIATTETGTAWTGSKYHSTVKLIIQGEYWTGTVYEVHSCEVLLARSSGAVVDHVVYSNVYTDDPLFTVTSRVDETSEDTVLEVENLTAGNLWISTFTTTLGSRD
jgi:hypothetical protein